jgi:hypothetical protein
MIGFKRFLELGKANPLIGKKLISISIRESKGKEGEKGIAGITLGGRLGAGRALPGWERGFSGAESPAMPCLPRVPGLGSACAHEPV